jgi:ATP-dependent DNA helicase
VTTETAPQLKTEQEQENTGRRKSGRGKAAKDKPSSIPDFFKPKVDGKKGDGSIKSALAKAAEDVNATGSFGAQNLRSARQPKLVTGGTMRDYQLEGLEWLKTLHSNGFNGILADEMGLGKTLQTISLFAFLREVGINGPFLIVAPLSTISNWVDEFHQFTPEIPVLMYHGTQAQRAELQQDQLLLTDQNKSTFPVVVTTDAMCMNDRAFLSKFKWQYMVIDEGHRIKNLNCKLIRDLKTYTTQNRLLITGTPLQNDLRELWSLLNFLMPEIFNSPEEFESWFDFSALNRTDGHKEIINQERQNNLIASLHVILQPFLLRRLKTDVETNLPPKREYVLYAPLTAEQKELYTEILDGKAREYLEDKAIKRLSRSAAASPKTPQSRKRKAENDPLDSAESSKRSNKKKKSYREVSDREYFKTLDDEPESEEVDEEEVERVKTLALARKEVSSKKLNNQLMQLRLVCNSPHLFFWPWSDTDEIDESLVKLSGKLLLLDRLLKALLEGGHKVLIFSQFSKTLDILQDYTEILRGWRTCRIDGSVDQVTRKDMIKDFNSDPEVKIFLLSTRAGGQGINLASADTVILFDNDWNPQQDLQAQDRAHRIGQKRPVIVYRLMSKGTVEHILLEKAQGKRRLEKLVIQNGKFKSMMASEDKDAQDNLDTLTKLLMEKEYERYEARAEGEILSDEDLETLMDRSPEAYEAAKSGLERDTFKVVTSLEKPKEAS